MRTPEHIRTYTHHAHISIGTLTAINLKYQIEKSKMIQNFFPKDFFARIFQHFFKKPQNPCKHYISTTFLQIFKNQSNKLFKKFFKPQTLENSDFQKILKKNLKKCLTLSLNCDTLQSQQNKSDSKSNKKFRKSIKK